MSVSRSSTARTRSSSRSKDEKIPRILGDLLGPESELADCQDFLLQLSDPPFEMAEDILKERVLLANRIANTIKIKKRIPSTTVDYYKVYYIGLNQIAVFSDRKGSICQGLFGDPNLNRG